MVVNSKQWLALYSRDVPECQLSDLQLDSRKVTAGQVFLALPGVNQHGNQFIPQALAQGAALVLTDSGRYTDRRVVVLPQLMQLLPAVTNTQLSTFNFSFTNVLWHPVAISCRSPLDQVIDVLLINRAFNLQVTGTVT